MGIHIIYASVSTLLFAPCSTLNIMAALLTPLLHLVFCAQAHVCETGLRTLLQALSCHLSAEDIQVKGLVLLGALAQVGAATGGTGRVLSVTMPLSLEWPGVELIEVNMSVHWHRWFCA